MTALNEIAKLQIGLPEITKKLSYDYEYDCIFPSALDENNILGDIGKLKRNDLVNPESFIKSGDILIKRINPTYVNLIKKDHRKTITTRNVILIRAKEGFYPAFIAAHLEGAGLRRLYHYTKSSTVNMSLSVRVMNRMEIPDISLEEQKAIGNIWLMSKEKILLFNKAIKAEEERMKSIIQEITT